MTRLTQIKSRLEKLFRYKQADDGVTISGKNINNALYYRDCYGIDVHWLLAHLERATEMAEYYSRSDHDEKPFWYQDQGQKARDFLKELEKE